jgi:beta-lactam-binding protein with PASTA domain
VDERVFGSRYRATEKLGSGGMADVFKAVDEILGRTVAIKVLHPQYAADANFVARFRQEAQAAANLSNPHIVNIYDWGREGDDTYYIVMEYVRGTDLKELVQQRGPADPIKAAEYGMQVCSALSVAHGYDIIHRDIKPHNIVLTPDGTIKVMDFGIARAGNTTMTQTGSVLGTAQYISPEQAQGRPLGPGSDLYSLGCVLYEITTGRLPFTGDTPVAVALKQVNEQPVPPRQLNGNIPPALEAVILKAMEKDPAKRYHSADEMKGELERVVSGRPVAAAAPRVDDTYVMPAVVSDESAPRRGSGGSSSGRGRVNPWVWALLAIALVAAGVGVAWALGLFGASITVPDVAGMTPKDATTALTAVGLKVGNTDKKADDKIPEGQVISTTPPAGTRVDKDTAVDLLVSTGIEKVNVPAVLGMTEDDAVRAIQQAGFKVTFPLTRGPNDKAPAGQVFAQSPAGDTPAAKGSAVALSISTGVQQIAVPDVKGQSQSAATTALKKAGFTVKVSSKPNSTVTKGTVYDQNPASGAPAAKGSEVTIMVSSGPEMVAVPDVKGQTEADAKTALAAVGLLIDVQSAGPPPDPTKANKVSNTDPTAGASVPKGSTVKVFVYGP